MPLVSVIMPSYNHEKFISVAIDSVLNQNFNDHELVIIDDASKDKSREIIESFKEKNNRIRAIFHKENKGIAKTLNEGIGEAEAEFIALIASDDVWVKNKLEKQLKVLEKNEDLIVWSEGEIIDGKGRPTGETFTQKHGALQRKKSGDIFEELLKGNFIFGSSFITKRENLRDVGFNEQFKYLNDWQFYVDLAKKYNYYYISEPLAKYRIHGSNTILSDRVGWQRDQIIIGEYFLQKYGNEISNEVKGKLFLNISRGYLEVGEKVKAREYIYYAIKFNLFDLRTLTSLVVYLTNENGFARKFLRWGYQKYKGVKNV